MVLPVVVVSIGCLFFLLLGLYLKIELSKVELEKGEVPLFDTCCGGIFDGVALTFPLVRLSIYKDFLVISYFRKIILRFDQISDVEMSRPWNSLTNLIRITHSQQDIPKRIYLAPWEKEKVRGLIEKKIQNH